MNEINDEMRKNSSTNHKSLNKKFYDDVLNDMIKLVIYTYKDLLVYDPEDNQWFYFHPKHFQTARWNESSPEEVKELIKELELIKYSHNSILHNKILESVKKEFEKPRFYESLDKNFNLWVFNNGVLELDTKIFRKIVPEDLISKLRDYSFDPKIGYKQVEKMMEDYLPDKTIRDNFLREISSYLSGGRSKIISICGGASTGKSTLIQMIRNVFGEYAMNISNLFEDEKMSLLRHRNISKRDDLNKRIYFVIQDKIYTDCFKLEHMNNKLIILGPKAKKSTQIIYQSNIQLDITEIHMNVLFDRSKEIDLMDLKSQFMNLLLSYRK